MGSLHARLPGTCEQDEGGELIGKKEGLVNNYKIRRWVPELGRPGEGLWLDGKFVQECIINPFLTVTIIIVRPS
jgi:hypothetical protein